MEEYLGLKKQLIEKYLAAGKDYQKEVMAIHECGYLLTLMDMNDLSIPEPTSELFLERDDFKSFNFVKKSLLSVMFQKEFSSADLLLIEEPAFTLFATSKMKGINVQPLLSIYKDYTIEQLNILVDCIDKHLALDNFINPAYSATRMDFIRWALLNGHETCHFKNMDFSKDQLEAFYAGYDVGIDVNVIAHKDYSPKLMYQMIEEMVNGTSPYMAYSMAMEFISIAELHDQMLEAGEIDH